MNDTLTRRLLVIVVAAAVLLMASCTADSDLVPPDPAPMLNGLISEAEWDQAITFEENPGLCVVHVWKNSGYIYLCIVPKDTVHSGLDLYVDNLDGDIFNLHVSSAHGRRFLSDTLWEEMAWGPDDLWSANLIQSIFEDGRMVFLAPEVFEFQIDRKLLPHRSFKLMLHFKRPELWVPANADTLSSDGWWECRSGP